MGSGKRAIKGDAGREWSRMGRVAGGRNLTGAAMVTAVWGILETYYGS